MLEPHKPGSCFFLILFLSLLIPPCVHPQVVNIAPQDSYPCPKSEGSCSCCSQLLSRMQTSQRVSIMLAGFCFLVPQKPVISFKLISVRSGSFFFPEIHCVGKDQRVSWLPDHHGEIEVGCPWSCHVAPLRQLS